MEKRNGNFKKKLLAFFENVREFFKNLGQDIGEFMETTVKPAVKFMNVLKDVINNPALDLFTEATKTDLDNNIIKQLRKVLPVVIDRLNIVVSLHSRMTEAEKTALFIEALKKLSPEMKKAAYHKTAALLAMELSENKNYTQTEIDTLTQIAYNELKAK